MDNAKQALLHGLALLRRKPSPDDQSDSNPDWRPDTFNVIAFDHELIFFNPDEVRSHKWLYIELPGN